MIVEQVGEALRELSASGRDRGAADRAEPRRRDRRRRRIGVMVERPHRAEIAARSSPPIGAAGAPARRALAGR
jgi:hypothetical protein